MKRKPTKLQKTAVNDAFGYYLDIYVAFAFVLKKAQPDIISECTIINVCKK